ncbi:SAF domain-containing protein [Sphaerimonospora cavernae]|uniref:SAF domain-containing protein n=1 Tax=Sphaerimonospora cavernae TaxID=1740611 RepID=A0ABV6TZP3_9ACTN
MATNSPPPAPPARPVPGKRRPAMAVVGVLAVVLSAVVGLQLYQVAAHRTQVLVMARDVPIGQVIEAQDLTSLAVGVVPGMQWTRTQDRDGVIGKRATADLRAGTLLAPSQFGTALIPDDGQQIVPIALKASQLPARGLKPGDWVVAAAVAEEGRQGVDYRALVDKVGQADADGTVVVDLLMPATTGTALARLAAEGKIAMVLGSKAGRARFAAQACPPGSGSPTGTSAPAEAAC